MTLTSAATPSVTLPNLVVIEGGEFVMGNDGGANDERPAHVVRLPSFRAAIAPVTNAEYARFVAETGAAPPPFLHEDGFSNPRQPVVGVGWFDAVAYCDWLTRRTGTRYRLPTEAEREYAARGPAGGVDWPWPSVVHPLADELRALDRPHEPLADCANGFGLRCMADNVHEWCSDWYSAGYYQASPIDSPTGPAKGKRRAARGGSWRHAVPFTRLTARASLDPSFRYNDFGFRLYADA